jgi:L-amino acid N-acyltransferase YncA
MAERARIRTVSPADVREIAAIYADAAANTTTTYELEPPSEGSILDKIIALDVAGLPFLVAEDPRASIGQGILGYAYVSPYRPRPAYRFTVEHSVYVAEKARRHGIGRLLMNALIDMCERLGFRQMVAVIGDPEHNTAPLRFHEQLCFHQTGHLAASGYKFGRWLDTVFMQRALNIGRHGPPDPESLPERRFRAEGTKTGTAPL